MTREAQNQRSVSGIMKRTYNNFSDHENEIECSICNNFSHKDSGCSKHMTGDKEKLQSYSVVEKERNVSFGNDTPALIKGKGSVLLKEKVKAGNVMYVDGLKNNLLSVSQMYDQGNEVIFRSNGCIVRELDTGEIVIKGIRTPNNLYILKGGQQ